MQSTFGGGLGANSTTAATPKANESNHNGVVANNSSTTTRKDSIPPAAAASFNGSFVANGHPTDARKRDERNAHKETEIETTTTTPPNANIIFETVKLSKPPTTTTFVAIDSKRSRKEESVKPSTGRTVSSSLSPSKFHKKAAATTLKSHRARDNCHQQQSAVSDDLKVTDKFESSENGDTINKAKMSYNVSGVVLSKNSCNNNLDNPLKPIYRQIEGIHHETVSNLNLSMAATPPPPSYSSLPRPTNGRIKSGVTGAFSLPPPLPKQHQTSVTTTKKPTSPPTTLLSEGRYYNNNVHQKSGIEKLARHENGDTDNGIDCGVLMGNENCFVVPSISNRHHHQQQQPHQTTLNSNGCNNNASLTAHNSGTTATTSTTNSSSSSSLRNNFNHIINNNNVVYNGTNKDTTDKFDKIISVPTLPAITSSSVAIISGGSNELHDIKEEVFVVSPSSTAVTTMSSSVTTQSNNDLPLYGCAAICSRTRNPFLQYPIDTLGRTSIVGSAIEAPTPMDAYNEQQKHVYQQYRSTKTTTTTTDNNDDLLFDDFTDVGTDIASTENYVNLDSKVISPEVMDALQLFLQEHGNEYIKQFLQVITKSMLCACAKWNVCHRPIFSLNMLYVLQSLNIKIFKLGVW